MFFWWAACSNMEGIYCTRTPPLQNHLPFTTLLTYRRRLVTSHPITSPTCLVSSFYQITLSSHLLQVTSHLLFPQSASPTSPCHTRHPSFTCHLTLQTTRWPFIIGYLSVSQWTCHPHPTDTRSLKTIPVFTICTLIIFSAHQTILFHFVDPVADLTIAITH